MDLAGPKIRTNIINKGQKKGRVKVKEGDVIWLSESNEGFAKKDIVISPNETGILSKLKKGDRVFIVTLFLDQILKNFFRKKTN